MWTWKLTAQNLFREVLVLGRVSISRMIHSPKLINMAPENGWLEGDPFLLGETVTFQGRTVKLRSGGGSYHS